MQYFLNFSVNHGFTVDSSGIDGIMFEHNELDRVLVNAEKGFNSSCSFDHTTCIELLYDCYFWQNSEVSNKTLQLVYNLIKGHIEGLTPTSRVCMLSRARI